MDRTKRIVQGFLNSAEGYFHTKRIVEDQVKQPRDLYGPMSNRPERWDYTDIRDITKDDLKSIVMNTLQNIDHDLFKVKPSTALNAALQYTIHVLDNGRFQSKIDAPTYQFLMNILKAHLFQRGM